MRIDACQDETSLVQSLGALGGGADTHSGDGMTDGEVEAALLRQSAGVGDNPAQKADNRFILNAERGKVYAVF